MSPKVCPAERRQSTRVDRGGLKQNHRAQARNNIIHRQGAHESHSSEAEDAKPHPGGNVGHGAS